MPGRERALAVLLRVVGVLVLTATFAVFLPTRWMEIIHQWIGLGEFPEAPLTEYLSRSLSAFYAMHGAILLLLSTDVRRFAPVIRLVGWLGVAFGVVMLGVDYLAPMPPRWTWSEGPAVAVMGLVVVWMARGIGPGPGRG